ncbi:MULTISPECIES: hypothetical protein [Giesbergeria]|uniref:Uncharacterized protein n=1 Tax=Giesbergeria sinuosa TaxID=80883 RepID=A0ABV9QA52_9BURK
MSAVPSEAKQQPLSLTASSVNGKVFRMPLFRPGTVVLRGTKRHTVHYVMIRRGDLWIYLNGVEAPVRPETLRVAPALFAIERQSGR